MNIQDVPDSPTLSTVAAENEEEDKVTKAELSPGSCTNTSVQGTSTSSVIPKTACLARCSSTSEPTKFQESTEQQPQLDADVPSTSSTTETKLENHPEFSNAEHPSMSSGPARELGSSGCLLDRGITPPSAVADDSSKGEAIPEGFEWINKLPKHMADETKRILKHGMTDEERDAIYEKYPIPDHLKKRLLPPKVNPEVWELLPPEAKYHDLSMCHIHKGLAHTVVALGEAVNIVKEKMETNNLNSDLSSLLLLSLSSSEQYASLGATVTEGRKDMIMIFLSSEAREEAKFTISDEYLFGEDFQNGRTSRMMKKVKGKMKTKRFRARR